MRISKTTFWSQNITVRCVGILVLSSFLFQVRAGQQSGTADSLAHLREIGGTIAKAVVAKDLPTLLTYDRPDLRSEDEILLKNQKSDLFCYIFDSRCIPTGQRSVYDILSGAHHLSISARELGKSSNATRWGLLLFYDSSVISQQQLRSSDFLCKEQNKKIVGWTFQMVDKKWVSANPPFGFETEGLC